MAAFDTTAEAATYRMLRQVLQNHTALHEMSILATTMACTGLLGDCGQACCATGTAPRDVVAVLLGQLKEAVHARPDLPALAAFAEGSADDPAGHLGLHARQLYDVLRQLLAEASEAHQLDAAGRRRIVLRLLADVVRMFQQQFQQTRTAVDTLIDTVVGPALDSYLMTLGEHPLLP